MDWTRWLRDFAIFGAAAAVVLVLARTVLAGSLARFRDAVGRWSARRTLAIVLVLTAVPRAVGLAAFEPPFEADAREYVEKAAAIADVGHPRDTEVRTDGTVFHRPLGSSLALAAWFRATGTRGLTSARVHGIALACAAAWLLLVLGRAAGRETDARVAALGYALFLPHVVFATIPYTETFVTVLVLAMSVFHERLRTDVGGWRSAAGLGLLGGWLAITRTEMAWLAPLSIALLAWERRRELSDVAGPAVVAGVLFLVPFAVNHEMRAGYPGHLRTSCQGGLIVYFGNNPIEVNGYGNATPEVQARVRELYAGDPTGGAALREAATWAREHPGQVAANMPKKAFHLWLAEPQGFRWHAGAGQPGGMDADLARALRCVAYAQSLLLLGLAWCGRRRLGPETRFWCAALVLHLAVWCMLASSTRNRYPLEPWLLVAAAASLQRATR